MKSFQYIFLMLSLLGASFGAQAQEKVKIRCELNG